MGKSNFFDGILSTVDGPTGTVGLPGISGHGRLGPGLAKGDKVSLSVRPEQIALTRGPSDIPVVILNRIFLGEHTEYLVQNPALGSFLVLVSRQSEAQEGSFDPGDTGFTRWATDTALILSND